MQNLPDARGIVESKRTFDLRMAYQDSLELDRLASLYSKYDEPTAGNGDEPDSTPDDIDWDAPGEPEPPADPDEDPEPWDEDTGEYDYPDAPDFKGAKKSDRLEVKPISGGAPQPADAEYEAWSASLFVGEYDDVAIDGPTEQDLEDMHLAGREPGVYGYE